MRVLKRLCGVIMAATTCLAPIINFTGCFNSNVDEDTLVIEVVFPGLSGMKPADQKNNPVADKIREKTGVNIVANFTEGSVTSKLTSIVSMGTESDLIMFRYGGTDDGADKIVKDAIAAGFFLPIGDYTKGMENLEPNYTTGLSQNFVKNGIDDPDFNGKRYILPMHTAKDTENETNWGYTVYGRKDILDDLGIDPYEVHTSQQLYDIAKRISRGKYKDINGNTVIPASCWQQGWSYEVFLNSFKYRQMTSILENGDGSLTWQGMDDMMVEEAKFMQKMIKEGLFDSEAFTQTDSLAREKHVNGSVALTGAHYSHIQNALEHTLYEDHPEMRYVPMGPIYDANGNPYMPETYTTMGLGATAVFVVPSSTKKLDKIIKYLDYINSEEGRTLVYLGIEGEDWEKTEKGEIRTTKLYRDKIKEDGRYGTNRGISSIYTYGVARLDNNIYEKANDVDGDPAVEYREKVREMYPLVRVDGVVATFWDDEFSRHDELLEVLITNDYKKMIESCYFANSASDIDNKVLAYRRAISKNNLMKDYLTFVKNSAAKARAEGINVIF